MPWRVELTTVLDCAPERAWAEVQTPRLLAHIAWPWLVFQPIQPDRWPEHWSPGRYLARMRALGVIPLGTQWVDISWPPAAAPVYQIHDNGTGQLVRGWAHLITLAPAAGGRTRYTDRVDVNAGLLTPFVWLFAWLFYAHRQNRWRTLVRRGFQYDHADR